MATLAVHHMLPSEFAKSIGCCIIVASLTFSAHQRSTLPHLHLLLSNYIYSFQQLHRLFSVSAHCTIVLRRTHT